MFLTLQIGLLITPSHPYSPMSPVSRLVNRKFLTAAGAVLLASVVGAAPALPTGGRVESGAATITQAANALTVHQTTAKLQLGWDSFSVGQGASVNFQQPSSSSLAVNMVRGADASVIAGAINANGRVVLVNPQGIAFTGSAQVNVGSLVASALRDANGDFSTGRTILSGAGGEVSNAGSITVAAGGHAVLAGSRVTNNGLILADAGKVALAAGSQVSLDYAGDGLIKLSVDAGAVDAAVANGGAIRVGSGQILLTAKAADTLASSVVSNTGTVQANGIVERGGEVWITADVVESSGTIAATSSQGQGGSAHLVGDKSVSVTGTVDVTGATQGGFVDVSAPAVRLPDLGLIKVGRGGTFLLDPDNITILAAGTPIVGDPTNSSPVTDIVLSSFSIETWLAGGANLTIQAFNAGSITVGSSITVIAPGAGALTLSADAGKIDVQQPISTTGGLTLFSSTGDIRIGANITASSISVGAGGDLTFAADMTSTAGDLGFSTLGNIYVDGNLTLTAQGEIYPPGNNVLVLTHVSQALGGSTFELYRQGTQLAGAGWLIAEDLAGPSFFNLAGNVSMQYGFKSGFALPTANDLAFVAAGQVKYPDPYMAQVVTTGLVRGDALAEVFSAPNLALAWTAGAPTATSATGSTFGYKLTLGAGFSINRPGYIFMASPDTGTLAVRPRELLVKPDDLNGTYGSFNKPAKYLYQVTGYQNGDSNVSLGITGEAAVSCTYDQAVPANRGAGDYPITITQSTLAKGNDPAGNYAFNLQPGKLSIAKAPLTITADDKSRDYGDVDPTFTVSGAVFQYSDTLATAITGAFVMTTPAGLTSDVGNYAINLAAGTAVAANYDLTLVNGTLTVNKAPLTVTMLPASKVYGDPLAASYPYVMTGFKNAETEAGLRVAGTLSGSVQYTSTATQSSDVGVYTITPISGSLTARNYAFTTFEAGNLTVTRRALTVSAAPSREYGLSNDAANITYNTLVTGWAGVNGDSQATRLSGNPEIIGAPAITANVGVYAVTIAQGTLSAGPNYDISAPATTYVNPTNFTVTKATSLRFVADDKTREYGDPNPPLTYTVTGFRNADTAAVLGGSPSLSTVANAFSNVGNYTITIGTGSLVAANYAVNLPVNFTNGTLSVTKATLQVTANDKSRAYGAANPAFDYSVTGFKNGQNLGNSGVSGAPTLTTDAVATSPVGPYTITAAIGNLASTNYAFDLVDGTLTVTKAPLSLKVDDATNEYGSDFAGFSLTMTGLQNGETQAGLRTAGALSGDAVYTYTNAQVKTLGVPGSPYTVAVTGLGTLAADNYSFVLPTLPAGTGQLTITKAPLRVVASDKTRIYGDANPALEYTLDGFKFGEGTLGAIGATGLPVLATAAAATTPVGAYPVTVDTGLMSSPNYSFTPVDGTITITKAPLTLKVDDVATEYGADFSGFTLTMTGFKNGETQAGLRAGGDLSGDAVYTYTNAQVKLLDVNGSPYTVAATGIGNLGATNYSFTVQVPPAGTGQLTITPAPITLKATGITRTYGDAWTQAQVDNQWDIFGLKNGQTRDGLLTAGAVTGAAAVTSAQAIDSLTNAGTYTGAVTATNGSFAVSPTGNYAFTGLVTPPAADLTIDKAAVVVGVSGTPLSKLYGAALPALNPSYTGLKNGQTGATAGLVGAPVITTTATASSNVGSYGVTVDISGLSAANYTFTKVDGTLNVTKAPLTVAADAKTREYGLSNPALTYAITGYVLGQNLATSGVTGTPALSTTAVPTSGVGSYPITVSQSTLASSNYSFNLVNSTLTITRAPLSLVADDKTKIYGDANPALTYSIVGLRQGDTAAVISGTMPAVTTTVDQLTGAGVYAGALVVGDTSGLSAANYTIGRVNGNFTVLKATLNGTVDNVTRYYGYPNPAFTVTWTGYKNADTAATSGFTGALAFTTDANPASPVAGSPYTISATQGTYSSPNYAFGTITSGLLTVERSNLWENNLYNLAAAPLAAAIRLNEIQARLRGQPLLSDPQARLNYDKYPFRLDLGQKDDAKRKKEEGAKEDSNNTVSKN